MDDVEDRIRGAIENLKTKNNFLSALVRYSTDVGGYYKNFKIDVDPNKTELATFYRHFMWCKSL